MFRRITFWFIFPRDLDLIYCRYDCFTVHHWKCFSGLTGSEGDGLTVCLCVLYVCVRGMAAWDIYHGVRLLKGGTWHPGCIHAASPAALVPFSQPAPWHPQQGGHSHGPDTHAAHERYLRGRVKTQSTQKTLDSEAASSFEKINK